MLEQLNAYAPLISAVAALISAVAAGFVAVFAYGTWQLYQYEKGRVEADEEEVRGALLDLSGITEGAIWELEGFLAAPEEERTAERYERAMYFCHLLVGRMSHQLAYLIERARSISPETVRYLSYLRIKLQALDMSLPEEEWEYGPDLDQRLLDTLDDLDDLSWGIDQVSDFPMRSVSDIMSTVREVAGEEFAEALFEASEERVRKEYPSDSKPEQPRSVRLGLRESRNAPPRWEESEAKAEQEGDASERSSFD